MDEAGALVLGEYYYISLFIIISLKFSLVVCVVYLLTFCSVCFVPSNFLMPPVWVFLLPETGCSFHQDKTLLVCVGAVTVGSATSLVSGIIPYGLIGSSLRSLSSCFYHNVIEDVEEERFVLRDGDPYEAFAYQLFVRT